MHKSNKLICVCAYVYLDYLSVHLRNWMQYVGYWNPRHFLPIIVYWKMLDAKRKFKGRSQFAIFGQELASRSSKSKVFKSSAARTSDNPTWQIILSHRALMMKNSTIFKSSTNLEYETTHSKAKGRCINPTFHIQSKNQLLHWWSNLNYFQNFPKSHISETLFRKILTILNREKPNNADNIWGYDWHAYLRKEKKVIWSHSQISIN